MSATACSRRAGTASCRACSAKPCRLRTSTCCSIWLRLGRTPATDRRPDIWRAIRADAAVGRPHWMHERDARLRSLPSRFLHEKTITPIGDLTLDAHQRCLLAALCCLPLLEFGERRPARLVATDRLSRRVPREPQPRRRGRRAARMGRRTDRRSLGNRPGDPVLGRRAWPTAKSRARVSAWPCTRWRTRSTCSMACSTARRRCRARGSATGRGISRWRTTRLAAEVDAGRETAIDGYAAEAPEEFFAVVSEYHFSDPRVAARGDAGGGGASGTLLRPLAVRLSPSVSRPDALQLSSVAQGQPYSPGGNFTSNRAPPSSCDGSTSSSPR